MNGKHNNYEAEGFKTLTLDVDYYQSFLEDPQLSDDQKHELIETLWTIMVQFVDLGFGIEATQLATTDKKIGPKTRLIADRFHKAGTKERTTQNNEEGAL